MLLHIAIVVQFISYIFAGVVDIDPRDTAKMRSTLKYIEIHTFTWFQLCYWLYIIFKLLNLLVFFQIFLFLVLVYRPS